MTLLLKKKVGLFGGLLASVAAAFAPSHRDYAPPKRSGPKVQKGAGYVRAQARLATKLKANKAIPSGERFTRQRRRQLERLEAKRFRISDAEAGRRKMDALRRGTA